MVNEQGPRAWIRGILLLALAARLAAYRFIDGFVWPDEFFQTLEPAHYVAFGTGLLPWEWDTGIRPWAVPWAYAALFRFVDLVGDGSTGEIVRCAQIVQIGLSLLLVDATWRMASALAGPRVAILAAVLAAVAPPLLYYAPRTLSDCTSTVFLFWGFARLVEQGDVQGRSSRAVWTGAIFGLSYLFRYTAPIFCIGPGLVLLARRQWRDVLHLAGGFAAVAVAIGLLDWITWGRPFHSLYEYVKFNVVEGGARRWGTQPTEWYLVVLLKDLGLAGFLTLAVVARGGLGTRGIGLGILVGFTLMSLAAHKEERFLFPVWAAVPAFLALGVWQIVESLRRFRAGAAAALALLLLASHALPYWKKDWRPYGDWYEGVRYVGAQPDARGMIFAHGWWASGGYALLHRPIPVLASDLVFVEEYARDVLHNSLYNYVVLDRPKLLSFEKVAPPESFREVARFGAVLVLRRTAP
jgi:hypothetical protein